MIDRTVGIPYMVVVPRNRDVFAPKRRITSRKDRDHVARWGGRRGRVARTNVRHSLEVSAAVARRTESVLRELRCDIVGGLRVPDSARFSAHHGVGCEGGESNLEIPWRDRRGRTGGRRHRDVNAAGGNGGEDEDRGGSETAHCELVDDLPTSWGAQRSSKAKLRLTPGRINEGHQLILMNPLRLSLRALLPLVAFVLPAGGQVIDLAVNDKGLAIGDKPRMTGLRINFRDRALEEVTGVNITIWQPYQRPRAR